MTSLVTQLLELYLRLGSSVLLGWFLGRQLPKVIPIYLGKFLFWVGVPLSIVAFLRQANLSSSLWIAPAVAWIAILLGAGLAWAWIKNQASRKTKQSSHLVEAKAEVKATQGSFLLATMVGNTGYLGYPITLALVGPRYFSWALFYDLLGTTLGAYGLGVIVAVHFGMGSRGYWSLIQNILKNPALWSFGLGLSLRQLPLLPLLEQSLQLSAWLAVFLSLVLIGMRLSQLSSWHNLPQAAMSLGIKMLLVPLVLGIGLAWLGVTGPPQLVIVLQMAMPPAFATLVLAETYDLDRDLAVTTLAIGSIGLLFTLPIWLFLFGR
jgi:predicted permease